MDSRAPTPGVGQKKEYEYKGTKAPIWFRIEAFDLFCFRTGVCILAFRFVFAQSDPFWIASAQYRLKNAWEKIQLPEKGEGDTTTYVTTDMKRLAKKLLGVSEEAAEGPDFFFYNPTNLRMNVLSMIETEPKDDGYRQELFYLRNCYRETYAYVDDETAYEKATWSPSGSTVWGVSPEAAVRLAVSLDEETRKLNHHQFLEDFKKRYMPIYVLLLHQKYMLYLLLGRVRLGDYDNPAAFREYRRQLYEFEINYVFTRISDTPQYQGMYERVAESFGIRELFEDIRDPLLSLSELWKLEEEEREKERDRELNHILGIISVLSLFSALMGGFDFIAEISAGWRSPSPVWIVQVLFSAAIFVFAIRAAWPMLFQDKDDPS